jgi:hypothetical protein
MPRGFDREGYRLGFLASAARQRFSRLRTDDRDITGISVIGEPGKSASMLLCRVSLHDAADPEKTLQGVLDEADKVVNAFMRDPGDQELSTSAGHQYTRSEVAYSRSRRGVLVSEILGMQNLIARGERRATVTHFLEDPTVLSRALRDLADLKPERFADYARPYLTAERARAVLFVPNGSGSRLADAGGGAALAEREEKTENVPPPKQLFAELLANPGELSSLRLGNGLSVILVRRPGLPLFSASVSVRVAPSAAKEVGARALARAMAFPASRVNAPSEYGGIASRNETLDSITRAVEGASGNAEAILATLAEEVRTMHLEPGAELRYRDRVLPSYERSERDPHRVADRAFRASVLPASPYGHVSEYRELESASAGEAKEWVDRTYVPGNAMPSSSSAISIRRRSRDSSRARSAVGKGKRRQRLRRPRPRTRRIPRRGR